MALIDKDGDVFGFGLDVVMHQANCINVMGGGIAGYVSKRYPEAYKADTEFDLPKGKARLGEFSWAWVDGNKFRIFNLYGQEGIAKRNERGKLVGNMTKVKKLEKAFRGSLDVLKKEANFSELKIGIPYKIGSDRAGGDWDEIRSMFDKVSEEYGIDLYVCRKEI